MIEQSGRTFGIVWESAVFLFPFCAVAFGFAFIFALCANRSFGPQGEGYWPRFRAAFPHFSIFAFLGLVTAYFLSLGLSETSTGFSNAILGPFAAALISLLTAGLGYFSKRQWSYLSDSAVIAGAICFMAVTVLNYQSLELYAVRTATG